MDRVGPPPGVRRASAPDQGRSVLPRVKGAAARLRRWLRQPLTRCVGARMRSTDRCMRGRARTYT